MTMRNVAMLHRLSDEDFHVGDIVTRCGDDRHIVIETNGTPGKYEPDLMTVECIRANSIYKVGDREDNLPRRYSIIRPGDTAPA